MAATVTFLTTGTTSWTVPSDFNNSNNTIECLGGGATGSACVDGSNGGVGGGAAAYSKITNLVLTLGTNITVSIGAGGAGFNQASYAGNAGGDSWFNGATLAASSCGAKGGSVGTIGGSGGTGGASGSGVGDTKYSGGNGSVKVGAAGGGGGGVAGPSGAGGNAPNQTGGTADNGTVVADAQGTEWDATHGCAGGGPGAGGGGGAAGGKNYGAGGGGAGSNATNSSAAGDGLIIITYTPAVAGGAFLFNMI